MRFIILLVFFTSIGLTAQSRYDIGFISSYNLNTSFNNNWILNLKGETRTHYISGFFKSNNPLKMDYQFTDVAFLASKKVGFNNWLAGGFQLRFSDELEKRFTQQFNIINEYYNYTIAHRITTDQTIITNKDTSFRCRYRFTYSKALSGNKLDIKEWYVKLSHEVINNFRTNAYDLELRYTPSIGYNFANSNKIELAIDYRLSQFLKGDLSHQGFVVLNYFFSI